MSIRTGGTFLKLPWRYGGKTVTLSTAGVTPRRSESISIETKIFSGILIPISLPEPSTTFSPHRILQSTPMDTKNGFARLSSGVDIAERDQLALRRLQARKPKVHQFLASSGCAIDSAAAHKATPNE